MNSFDGNQRFFSIDDGKTTELARTHIRNVDKATKGSTIFPLFQKKT